MIDNNYQFPYGQVNNNDLILLKKKPESILDKFQYLEDIFQLGNDLSSNISLPTKDHSPLSDIDPDLNVFFPQNDMLFPSSNYHMNSSFNTVVSRNRLSFSIFNVNVRSSSANFHKLLDCIDSLEHSFSVIGCSETWLKEYNSDLFNINGYNHEYNLRAGKKRGGGVSLYVSNKIQYQVRDDIKLCSSSNCIAVEIDKNSVKSKKNVIIIMMYRPPNTKISTFNDSLQVILRKVQKENKYACVLGDFNIDTYIYNKQPMHNDAEHFCNLFQSFSYKQLINRPTRYSLNSPTLLDNVYTNLSINMDSCDSGILCADISDHFPVFCIFYQLNLMNEDKFITKRDFCDKNKNIFKNL